jgi:hypothetical protein
MIHRVIFIVVVGEVFEGAINMQAPVHLKGKKRLKDLPYLSLGFWR